MHTFRCPLAVFSFCFLVDMKDYSRRRIHEVDESNAVGKYGHEALRLSGVIGILRVSAETCAPQRTQPYRSLRFHTRVPSLSHNSCFTHMLPNSMPQYLTTQLAYIISKNSRHPKRRLLLCTSHVNGFKKGLGKGQVYIVALGACSRASARWGRLC